jgi:membrane protease subunit HflK
MSDSDKHPQDRGHDHGHAHDHDHAHEPAPAPPEMNEDAGTQALSDALRSSFVIVKVIMVGLVALFLFSGFFTVKPQEKAIILRFGKPIGELLNPGPHWALPSPIEEVIRIPVGQVQVVNSSIGWYGTTAAAEAAGNEPPPGESLDPLRDGYLITGDQNLIHARATLRYRIADPPLGYVMNFANAANLVKSSFDSALVYAASRYQVDDVLTRDAAGFRELIRARMDDLIAQQGLGIVVDQIADVRIIPPRQLKAAFARVGEAETRRGTEINNARSYENQTVSKARAEAEARRNAGETERTRLVKFVAAEVERFTNNLPAWRANRELFVQQRQADVMRVVFTNAVEKTALPERADGKRTLWLQLSREPFTPKTLEQPKDTH